MPIRELQDGQDVREVLLVREAAVKQKRRGGDYLALKVGDRTGSVPVKVWDDVARMREVCALGNAVWVVGRYEVDPEWGPQINLGASPRVAQATEYDRAALVDGPARPVERLEEELRFLIGTVQNPYLSDLLEALLGPDAPSWPAFRDAPAAKRIHQAYEHGLLEHTLSVAQGVSALSGVFELDRDVAVTGALLHDLGKIDVYTADDPMALDLTDAGKLEGEIPLTYFRVRRAIVVTPDFPRPLARAVLHIVSSHHGTLEHGAAVTPCTREAMLVHAVDALGGKLGSFDRLAKELPVGERWSNFDRALGGGIYIGAEDREAIAA